MVQEEGTGDVSAGSGMNAKLNKILLAMEAPEYQKKRKFFKLPRKARAGAKRKLKNGYVLVCWLKSNKQATFELLPTERDLVYNNGQRTFHLATTDFQFWYDKYPMAIIPEWSLTPLNPHTLFGDTVEDKRLADAQVALINKFESGNIKPKKSFGGKALILIGIIVVVVLYFISKMVTGGQV